MDAGKQEDNQKATLWSETAHVLDGFHLTVFWRHHWGMMKNITEEKHGASIAYIYYIYFKPHSMYTHASICVSISRNPRLRKEKHNLWLHLRPTDWSWSTKSLVRDNIMTGIWVKILTEITVWEVTINMWQRKLKLHFFPYGGYMRRLSDS